MPARSDIERALLRERLRLGAVLAVLLGSLLYLGAALYQVQVEENHLHTTALDRHSIRRVRLPAIRGRILDRTGIPLADSVPSYTLGVFVEELRRPGAWSNTVNAVDRLVDDLGAAIGRPARDISRDDIENHIRLRRPLALTAFRDLTDREIALFLESPTNFPGVDIQVQPRRIYPLGDCAAHIVGHVGKAPSPRSGDDDEEDVDDEDFDFYLPDLYGQSGIEKAFDGHLAGVPGGELVRIDAIGFKHDTDSSRPPENGRDVVLALDVRLQRHAEAALDGRRGAIVVVDVRNGEIPVLATAPRYDLSTFLPTLRHDVWRALMSDPDRPLINRATQAIYPPGSTLKPFVALAALDAGATSPYRSIDCTGAFRIGDSSVLRCGHRIGHGPIDLGTAIEQSCNVYFCQVGTDLGYEPRLHDALAAVGLGQRPAIEIPASAGLLPTAEWKRRTRHDAWRTGDTANLAIGQGFLCATPLQMAMAVAAIANGGDLLEPRLVASPRPAGDAGRTGGRRKPWKASSLAAVREGMHRVVDAPKGGGRRAHIDHFELAGKTGTAEYGSEGRKHTWMVAYGPYRDPEYAIVVLVEDGESGGKTAAPIVQDLFAALYGLTSNSPDEEYHEEYYDLPEVAEVEEVATSETSETSETAETGAAP